MNSESGSMQRNSALDLLKQRQKVSAMPPTLMEQKPSILYTMPMQTVERLEDVLRKTLALQESIRAGMDTLATKESLEPLATGTQLVDWLEQADEIHREVCQELRRTVSEMEAEVRQAGKQREEFMRQLSQQARELRGDGAELMNTFRRWAARTILSSAAAALVISILVCRLLM